LAKEVTKPEFNRWEEKLIFLMKGTEKNHSPKECGLDSGGE
jgi:hypothetical protein